MSRYEISSLFHGSDTTDIVEGPAQDVLGVLEFMETSKPPLVSLSGLIMWTSVIRSIHLRAHGDVLAYVGQPLWPGMIGGEESIQVPFR